MKASKCYSLLLIILACSLQDQCLCGADPTDGFTPVPSTDENFDLQKPYDKPLSQRYYYSDGIRSLRVYDKDKPFKRGSGTGRYSTVVDDYSSGVWQFEGHAYVPKGTSAVTIVQIHGAAEGATTLQLRIYHGNMRYYSYNLVATDLYDKWFRVNVIHDVGKGKVIVFIDGEEKFVVNDQGPGDPYFKCGVCRTSYV
ncbi:PREDICTED: citrate-binding protein [Theobroma cacao]|uniref:Citrate-binding protein n=1 Tax=Theobroma cacao TaxID=3641 RepID=A0AB32WU97_THECC|nr:PREDICTED: citrate-binding protein [Theobroma cacao]